MRQRDAGPIRDLSDVSALIVAYGAVDLLRTAVASLVEAGVGEVIVWDNSPSETDRIAIADMAGGRVAVHGNGENLGFGRGNNEAASRASGRYLLLVNSDCEVTLECIASMRRRLADGSVGVVAPRMSYPDGSAGVAGGPRPRMSKELLAATRVDDRLPPRVRTWLIELYDRLTGNADRGMTASRAGSGVVDMDWVSGFCMMLASATFHRVGGFDPRFFMYFEDVDLCERVSAGGQRVLLDRDVVALHHESSSAGGAKSALYWQGLATYWAIRDRTMPARTADLIQRWSR